MVEVRMTMDEYLQLISGLSNDMPMDAAAAPELPKKKRKTAYMRRYEKNFKKIAPQFKMKSGKWKKNGFKNAVKMAHKMSKK